MNQVNIHKITMKKMLEPTKTSSTKIASKPMLHSSGQHLIENPSGRDDAEETFEYSRMGSDSDDQSKSTQEGKQGDADYDMVVLDEDQQRKMEQKREYNRRNAARFRQRRKDMIQRMHCTMEETSSKLEESQASNAGLRKELDEAKRLIREYEAKISALTAIVERRSESAATAAQDKTVPVLSAPAAPAQTQASALMAAFPQAFAPSLTAGGASVAFGSATAGSSAQTSRHTSAAAAAVLQAVLQQRSPGGGSATAPRLSPSVVLQARQQLLAELRQQELGRQLLRDYKAGQSSSNLQRW